MDNKRTIELSAQTNYAAALEFNCDSIFFAQARSVTWELLIESCLKKILSRNSILVGDINDLPSELLIGVNQTIARLAGDVEVIDLVESALNIGDIETAPYDALKLETNWTNNFSNAVAGVSGDLRFGVGENGTSYYAFYGQFEWNRFYSDPRPQATVFGLALITEVITSANWDGISTYNASSGDLNQFFINGGYKYKCIDGALHTWFREPIISNTLTITDATFIPFPAIKILAANTLTYSYEIPAKHDIVQLRAIAGSVQISNIKVGSLGTKEVSNLEVLTGCTLDGDITITLNGVPFAVGVTTAANTATLVATLIRGLPFTGYTTGGTGVNVIFTSNEFRSEIDMTFTDTDGTGVTATPTTTIQGVDVNDDIVADIALPTVVGDDDGIRLTYIVNPNFPTTANRTIYIALNNAAKEATLQIVLQKIF